MPITDTNTDMPITDSDMHAPLTVAQTHTHMCTRRMREIGLFCRETGLCFREKGLFYGAPEKYAHTDNNTRTHTHTHTRKNTPVSHYNMSQQSRHVDTHTTPHPPTSTWLKIVCAVVNSCEHTTRRASHRGPLNPPPQLPELLQIDLPRR